MSVEITVDSGVVSKKKKKFLCKTHVDLKNETITSIPWYIYQQQKNNDYKTFRVCKSGLMKAQRALSIIY